ncbi:MAG: hypothetical protein JNJ46_12940 [Myxococcales bacterium]|nr:hypothetical protein [Myxococcales bacterium]
MKINFSELLASERVRPLWGRSFTQESAMDELQRILRNDPATGGPQGTASSTIPAGRAGNDGADPARAVSVGASGDGSTAARVPGEEPLPDAAQGERSAATESPGDARGQTAARSGSAADSFVPPMDLADVPIRPPHEIFAELDRAVQSDLGNRACMVRNFIEALRVRVHALDPTADEALYHPLRHAAGGSIWELLGRMEDTLSGLRRVAAGR